MKKTRKFSMEPLLTLVELYIENWYLETLSSGPSCIKLLAFTGVFTT